jgi:hypothetical protein
MEKFKLKGIYHRVSIVAIESTSMSSLAIHRAMPCAKCLGPFRAYDSMILMILKIFESIQAIYR